MVFLYNICSIWLVFCPLIIIKYYINQKNNISFQYRLTLSITFYFFCFYIILQIFINQFQCFYNINLRQQKMRIQQKNKKIVIGKAVFKPLFKKKSIFKQIKTILNLDIWIIQDQSYKQNKWKHIFQEMESSSTQELSLNYNYNSEIIMEIQNVQFNNLKRLSLYHNLINNIQSLTLINCQNLESLSLSNNNICQISCLKKFLMPFLDQLYLYNNPIKQMICLQRTKINHDLFQVLSLSSHQDQKPINEDLSYLVKIECKSIKAFHIQSIKIKKKNIISLLKIRFPEISIFEQV